MTQGYPGLKPVGSCSHAILALKWSHSILEEETFVSEWGARENARFLELEVMLNNIQAPSGSAWSTPKLNPKSFRSRVPNRRVGFADEVEVRIGLADGLHLYPVCVPQDLIGSGQMPWHLGFVLNPPWCDLQPPSETALIPRALTGIPGLQCRVPTHTQVHELPHEHDVPMRGLDFPPDDRGDVPILPNFVQQILQGDHTAEDDDWDRGMTVRTWFLHHTHQHHCELPRLMQMVGDAMSWRNQLIALWIDVVQQGEPLQIFLADPDPPRPADLEHVAHDLLIVQGTNEHRKAGLVTAMTASEPFQYWSAAELLPVQVSGIQLVNVVHMVDPCQQNRCHVFHRWTEIPINHQPLHVMDNGRAFALHFHSTAASASTQPAPALPLPQQVHVPAPPVLFVPDDEVSDSADDMEEVNDNSDNDYSPSAHEGVVDLQNLQGVTVYRLHEDPMHLYIRWQTYAEVVVDLANRLQIPIDEILTYHSINVAIVGQHPAEAAIILQHTNDIPVGSSDKLIVLDLEIHQHPGQQILPATPHVARKVCRVLQHVTRDHLLMHAGVLHYCHQQFDRCLVQVNNQLWALQDATPRQLRHGDYARIVVPPPLQNLDGTLYTIAQVERQHRNDLAPDVQPFQQPAQVPSELPAEVQYEEDVAPRVMTRLFTQSSDRPYGLTERPVALPPGEASRPITASDPTAHNWLLPVGMIHLQRATTDGDEPSPTTEWITWFLQTPFRVRSDESRPLRLDVEQHLWLHDLCQVWRDRWIPYFETQVYIVAPEPPKAPHQHHVGHLILVQGHIPNQVPVLLTTIFETALGRRLSHTASFVPIHFTLAHLLHTLRLEHVCQDRGCWAVLDGNRIPDHGFGQADAGDNIHVIAPARYNNGFSRERLTDDSVAHGHRPRDEEPLTLSLFDLIELPSQIQVDFRSVQDLRNTLLACDLGHVLFADQVVKWHPATQAAFDTTPAWTCEHPIGFSFYTDGSSAFLDNERVAAAAVVMIVHTALGDRFGGFRCYTLEEGAYAPQAEMTGVFTAALWAAQLCDRYSTSFPELSFFFDCLVAGNTASGEWRIIAHSSLQSTTRSLIQWIERRFQVRTHWYHVYAHSGVAWNEAADAVTWAVVAHWIDAPSFQPIWRFITACDPAVHWLWLLEAALQHDATFPPIFGGFMTINASAPLADAPSSCDHPMACKSTTDTAVPVSTSLMQRCATANVLTLHPNKNAYGTGISARMESLLRSFANANIDVVGIQESRSRLHGHVQCEGFHVLSSSASSKGVGGVQL